MSSENQSNTAAKAQPRKPPPATERSRPLFPPFWVRLIVGICLAVILLQRVRAGSVDRAEVNVHTLILSFLAVLAVGTWFTFFSGYSRTTRLLTVVVVLAWFVLAGATLQIEHVSGELVPSFKFRWAPRPDQMLSVPDKTESPDVDLATTTELDFPQFLGPNRDAVVTGVKLDKDWDARPPKLLWRQRIGAGWSAFSVVNGFAVTLEQRGDNEMVTCYDALTGEPKWWHSIEARHSTIMGGVGPRSTPTVHEGNVYALGATGVLHCLDGQTGKPIWRHDLLAMLGTTAGQDGIEVAWGRAASPLIVDDLVVVPGGGPPGGPYVSLLAFDRRTGRKVWQGGKHQVSYSSPCVGTVAGTRQILIVNESSVSGHAVDDGRQLWRHEWKGDSSSNASVPQPVPLADDRVFLSKGYGIGAALLKLAKPEHGDWNVERLWHQPRLLRTKFTNVCFQGGYVYGLSDGVLECVDWENGHRMWKGGRYGQGQILLVGGVLLVQAESGEVVMVEASAEGHREIARFQAIEGKTWNNLCLYGPRLLVRNSEEAACYELPIVK